MLLTSTHTHKDCLQLLRNAYPGQPREVKSFQAFRFMCVFCSHPLSKTPVCGQREPRSTPSSADHAGITCFSALYGVLDHGSHDVGSPFRGRGGRKAGEPGECTLRQLPCQEAAGVFNWSFQCCSVLGLAGACCCLGCCTEPERTTLESEGPGRLRLGGGKVGKARLEPVWLFMPKGSKYRSGNYISRKVGIWLFP